MLRNRLAAARVAALMRGNLLRALGVRGVRRRDRGQHFSLVEQQPLVGALRRRVLLARAAVKRRLQPWRLFFEQHGPLGEALVLGLELAVLFLNGLRLLRPLG